MYFYSLAKYEVKGMTRTRSRQSSKYCLLQMLRVLSKMKIIKHAHLEYEVSSLNSVI